MPFSTKRSYSDFVTGYSFQNELGHTSDIVDDNIPRNSSFKSSKSPRFDTNNFENLNENDNNKNKNTLLDSYFDIKYRPSNLLSLTSKNIQFNNDSAIETATSSQDEDNNNNSFNIESNYRVNSSNRKSISRPGSICSYKKNSVPKQDLIARERCFDYIIQAIDEAWAMYCNTTSSAEAEVYGNLNNKMNKISYRQSKERTSDEETTEYSDSDADDFSYNYNCNGNISDDETTESCDAFGYKSEATNVADDETDSSDYRTVSELPDCMKFQSLKCRLTKAKNDLEDCYDSKDYEDCITFWNRWDMIKYSAVEIMEDDDDDEVVENALDELEEGRCYLD
ncbi:similar to Kazachstania africana KAFR_0D00200 hypothetical protein [Maudiozyma saulgeensis]|uniref:Uncharacterized protein n=1 Tax=Maudiozyma saulgeensis TaxID=1789683 RepID=A0A1X7R3N9_9SACH|nr:similar to Kazachstania africana KAFR_0D00200 hypothetical protein [Kazachstania saulgeensis]